MQTATNETKTYSDKDLAKTIDHTVLRPTSTTKDIEIGVKSAVENKFRSFVTDPCYAEYLIQKGLTKNVLVASVLDFPHGRDTTQNRVNGIKELLKIGICEIDIVSKYHLILEGNFENFKKDIRAIIKATNGKTLKIILEVDCLTIEQIKKAVNLICEVVKEEKTKNIIIKTKTGFAENKIHNLEVVRLMRKTLEENMLYANEVKEITTGKIGIKASGGIKTREDAISLLDAGAHILGTSSGDKLLLP